ncbi:MAG: FAD-dependent 5-carboxymethylaminomethyl-2-thiouridine(34) oxidoreductase MnmC [Burkholderiales bacterium]|nr:FAD-dependent 5-carboxymethylaminomethyl-2-thiouridine(34) oxidoreductase MnmC [Burkholderiales bacterium]
MKTQPIEPARIEFGAAPGDPPRSPVYGDLYHSRIGALAQARHVFLQGNGLPGRWAGRARFTVLETGFGLGNNFLATWDAWQSDPARCERLFYVALERHPPRREDLVRAQAGSPLPQLAADLCRAWPPLTPNLHRLAFDDGRVQLLLALGDVAAWLPALRVQADAFYLDGFAPLTNPAMWQPRVLKALGRKAAPGATLATWSVARSLREGLATAGFAVARAPGIGGKREISVARYEPRHDPRQAPQHAAPDPAHEPTPLLPSPAQPPHAEAPAGPADAVVVGAGIAGAAVASALAELGLAVTVLEREAAPAGAASGNPGGLFHGSLNADDGPHARLFRAAAMEATRAYAAAIAAGVPGRADGLLRLAPQAPDAAAMQAVLERQALPPDYVQVLDAAAASARAGIALAGPAWYYPGGGWIEPRAWVMAALASPRIQVRTGVNVAGLARTAGRWQLHDAAGRTVAAAPVVVLANADGAEPLLAELAPGFRPWPLARTRGQITHWSGTDTGLRLPIAGDGYALPWPGGGLLCGATRDADPPSGQADDARPRVADHLRNLARLNRLTGLVAPADPVRWQGRVGWRLQADDRLPVCGAVPLPVQPAGSRQDQARLLVRQPGLFVMTALGSRGLTLAPLLGRLIAAQATGTPWPLEQDLVDAIDPGRWQVRAARRGPALPGGRPVGDQPWPG